MAIRWACLGGFLLWSGALAGGCSADAVPNGSIDVPILAGPTPGLTETGDSATLIVSGEEGSRCVEARLPNNNPYRDEATRSAGGFCNAGSVMGLSLGSTSMTMDSDGSGTGSGGWVSLIFGIGPPGLEGFVMEQDGTTVTVPLTQGEGMTGFVVQWTNAGDTQAEPRRRIVATLER